jgi:hypothetical protein
MHKRFVFSAVVSAVSVVAMGGAGLAAGGGFGGPGTIKFHDQSAQAQLTDSNGTFMFISVDRGMQTYKLRGVNGPPVMVGPETVLSYFSSDALGNSLNGCFVIPDSSFTVASNLSNATLNVDPSVETPCPGFLIPAGAGGRPGLSGVVPDAGGGGGGGLTPITANIVWTLNGAVTSFSNTTNTRCQGTVAHSNGSSTSTFASVSGTVSPLTNFTAQFATIGDFTNTAVTTGFFSSACTGA